MPQANMHQHRYEWKDLEDLGCSSTVWLLSTYIVTVMNGRVCDSSAAINTDISV